MLAVLDKQTADKMLGNTKNFSCFSFWENFTKIIFWNKIFQVIFLSKHKNMPIFQKQNFFLPIDWSFSLYTNYKIDSVGFHLCVWVFKENFRKWSVRKIRTCRM